LSASPGRVAGDIEACATRGLRGNDLNAESGESVVLADSVAKPETGGFGRFVAKAGNRPVAGKSEITEGCSDLREIGDSSDLPGISDVRLSKSYGSDAAGAAERREAGAAGAANCWCGGAAAIGGSGVWLASVPLLERAPC
jgi:hypothetical protein